MKTQEDIEARLRGRLLAELVRRVDLAYRRLPHLCTHNHRHTLDARKRVADEPNENYNRIVPLGADVKTYRSLPMVQTMGLCMLGSDDPETWPGAICEEPIDAQRCPYFDPKTTKDKLLVTLQEELAQPGWVAEHLPEVAALAWVLELAQVPAIPWWRRLWYRIVRISVEPVRAAPDLNQLLTSVVEPDAGVDP